MFSTNGHHHPLLRRRLAVVLAAGLAFVPEAVQADGGDLSAPANWSDWNSDPVLAANLALGAWLYFVGSRRLRERSRTWRSASGARVAAFGLAWATLILALQSPLDAMSEQLASAHMVQHMLVMTIAAPALVMSEPGRVWGAVFSPRLERSVARGFGRLAALRRASRNPYFAFALYGAATWVWHWPWLYQAALARPAVHDLQHLTFFGAAFLFWRVLIDPVRQRRVVPYLAIVLLFVTTLHTTVLGVAMTLAPHPWYADYFGRTEMWGWTPLEDQRLAGLIMWMPACVPYLLAALSLLAGVLTERDPSFIRHRPQLDR